MKKFYFFVVALFSVLSLNAQVVNIPDANFKTKLIALGVDLNFNNEIEISEALSINGLNLDNCNISDMTGIKSFTNLTYLSCQQNLLTSLDTSNMINIENLFCGGNFLTSLNVSGMTNLWDLNCSFNLLTEIDVKGLSNMAYLWFNNNQIETLDTHGMSTLSQIYAQNNQLTSLLLKGASGISNLELSGNPNLSYICAETESLPIVESYINQLGYNCLYNSDCMSGSGGNLYTIEGNAQLDIDMDGCEPTDPPFTMMQFVVTSNTETIRQISSTDDTFRLGVADGLHTIVPLLENPDYFSFFPPSITVNVPLVSQTSMPSFCITAIGNHNDLEVILIPLGPAIPGFDASYQLICKNKGNTMQTANVEVLFDGEVLDYVFSAPLPTMQTPSSLIWNLNNFQPLETKIIKFNLNLNTPVENPSLTSGDILSITSTISSSVPDEMPSDNSIVINQTVVNSFDPNDKTCLEGATITSDMIGKYLHYIIRFENTGTAAAQNIVIKDIIDTTKFDINSLVSLTGSHSFTTRISDSNKVEFLFENIQLPFDDANNDGYVSFKIKTLPSLVEGNTIENTASIYFDYNLPIITNTAVTTIQDFLSTSEFSDSNFVVYPNPANEMIHLTQRDLTKKTTSVIIYNMLGQQMIVVTSADNISKVDISTLASGNYLVKMKTETGTSTVKFLKR